ncbi:hypothetical protein [Mycolicibacterium helvum]|uniref:Immunity factor for TNT n=1 Tax=Mycolicibacterium helvum TaxID=1534349 RepID=A0A7I7T8C7_9MYCO|nr:hypothetical protein [Mycolicibacterium helvum]BBY65043.1 hypothetical protein MHEL_32860 [Mycolicibacterium helvum]
MTDTADFARLSQNWLYWSELGQLSNLSVSTSCADCTILFSSNDYSVHLRDDGSWWVVDTVNDRRQRQNDTAKFSNYGLAEKYLIWVWGSTARSVVRAPILGPKLYAQGFASGIAAIPISEGTYELRSLEGRAVLMEPYATIFSHLMRTPEDEIERILRTDLN